MGRKNRELPEFVEQDAITKDVRCLICKEGDPTNFGKWIHKGSLANHLRSGIHEAHCQSKAQKTAELAENARKLREAYSGPEVRQIDSGPQAPSIPLPAMFQAEDDDSWSPSYDDFAAAGLAAPVIPIGMTLLDPHEERNRLRAEVEKILSHSEQNEDEDDITLPELDDLEDELDDDMAYTNVAVDAAYAPYALCETRRARPAGIPRLAAETKKTLEEQINLAMYGIEAPILRLQTATGVKDKVAQYWIDILLQKAREMKANDSGRTADSIAAELKAWLLDQPGDKVNPLLDISGLDPNRDTPVEILHTILLGIIKYVWYILHSGWSEAQRDLFVIRLQSTDIDGLTVPPIRSAYMMRSDCLRGYALGPRNRRHGSICGIVEFLCSYTLLFKTRQKDLTVLIGNVLDAFGDQDPAKILLKIKLHLLPHIVEDAIRFGPPIRNSTEVFECFNAIFRLCSILCNHQAPSRDIAVKFASMDRVKHMLSGGFWKANGEWVCAGPKVCSVLKNMPIIQRHLGWVPPRTLTPGKMRLAANAIGVTAQSGDFCRMNSWVFARDSENQVVVGRICELLFPESRPQGVPLGLVTLDVFAVSEILHPDFGMPVLQKPADSNGHRITVLATAVMFRFSAQHDCRLAKCAPTALRPIMQERQETSRTMKLLAHADDEHFVINMAAIHNATLLRRNLPVSLTVPRPLYLDRKAHHDEVAIGLRAAQTRKRSRTQAKRRATLKAKKIASGGALTSDEESEPEDESEEEEPVRRKRQQNLQNILTVKFALGLWTVRIIRHIRKFALTTWRYKLLAQKGIIEKWMYSDEWHTYLTVRTEGGDGLLIMELPRTNLVGSPELQQFGCQPESRVFAAVGGSRIGADVAWCHSETETGRPFLQFFLLYLIVLGVQRRRAQRDHSRRKWSAGGKGQLN
ncbi:hypothetical protein B0H11DRAFT_1901510 [Mycena galericulata]|nr:hypothetical protein B0H11DRAFT_1901510 [Mycena galericulata]